MRGRRRHPRAPNYPVFPLFNRRKYDYESHFGLPEHLQGPYVGYVPEYNFEFRRRNPRYNTNRGIYYPYPEGGLPEPVPSLQTLARSAYAFGRQPYAESATYGADLYDAYAPPELAEEYYFPGDVAQRAYERKLARREKRAGKRMMWENQEEEIMAENEALNERMRLRSERIENYMQEVYRRAGVDPETMHPEEEYAMFAEDRARANRWAAEDEMMEEAEPRKRPRIEEVE